MAGINEPGPAEAETPAEAEAPAEAAPARRRSWPYRLAKVMGTALLVLVGIVIVALFALDTGPGRRFVADQIRALEFENGMQIRIGRIDGSLYGEMVLRDLSIWDPEGEFLYAPEAQVDWRPFAFIGNHIDIRSATAQRLILRRLPEFRETPPSDDPLLPDLDIDINELRIDRFIVEAPVTGERRVLALGGEVHIASGRAQVDFAARTLGTEGTSGGDRLTLRLDAVPEENRLLMDLDLFAPADGVISALAGISQPLAVSLQGSGDWQVWDGTLDARLDGGELADFAIRGRDGSFTIEGVTRVARLLSGPTANLLSPVVNVDLTATLDERRADLSGGISGDAFRLNTNGIVDLGDNSFEDLKLAFVLLRPSTLADNLSGSGVRAMLTLNGDFATPRVGYALHANRLSMNDIGLVDFTATGAARVDTDRILIPVSARAQRITGLDSVAGGTLANVRLDGDIAVNGLRILSDNMRIRSDRINATAVLLANMETGLYTGAIDGRIDDYRVESVGLFNIETDLDLEAAPSGFALSGRVRARSTRLLNETVENYLGGNFVAGANVRYQPDGTMRFANLQLEAPDLRIVGGSGSYSPDGRIALNADATSDRYGAIGVRVAGTLSNPQARITAERPDLGIGLADLDAEITGIPGGYRLDLTGETDYGPLEADVSLGLGARTSLTINNANLSGIDFAGRLEQTRAGPFAGTLTARGNGLGGIVELGAEGRHQEVQFNLRANNTVFAGPANLVIGSAIIDGRAVLYDQPYLVADAQLANTRYGGFDINAGRVLIDYQNGRGHAKALVEGTAGAPFRIAANADLQPEVWRVALTGRARGNTFKTVNPARILLEDGSYELLPTRIDLGSGSIRLAGTYGEGIRIQSRLDELDLALINAFVPGLGIGGTATGSLDFNQADATAFPQADARLQLSNFARTTAVAVSQPVDINIVGRLFAEGGEARAVIRRRGSVIGRMTASLSPLPPGAGPWTERLLAAPLGGGIRYNGPAETLFSFAGQPDQRLTGNVGVAADFSCRVNNPCLAGIVRGENLTYVNQTYGTRLTNLGVAARFDGNRVQLESLQANAGDGTVSGSGYVSLAAEVGYPMDVSVTLDNARLARSDALSATATGQLRLTKSASQTALLSGQIRLPETRYQVILQGSAEVPQLTGVRFRPQRGRERITGDEPAETAAGVFSLVRLDLDLVAPDQLYVSGMGLESEWEANLNISGTSAEPRLGGEVSLVRGTLGFAGRSFELLEGNIAFTGGQVIDPVLNIVASEDVEDVTVNINVSGRATNPQIGFSSTPSLPQDEILARILFGSSIANLSTIQAVQLASSLNSLRGTGGGLNPLGQLRSATGVDRLRILGADDETGRGTALAAGQYLTDDVYVELITDARGFTATQLEVSLTNWLSVMSQAGGSGVSNVNVRIRRNY